MNYTIPQLEGLAEAISKINESLDVDNEGSSKPLTGQDAVDALHNRGLL